jgi:hypothetical protein
MFTQFAERGRVKDVCARFRSIKREHADVIVADFTLNHRAG